MRKNQKVYVAGHRGLIGSALMNELRSRSYTNVVGQTREELDLLNESAVNCFFEAERPDIVILAAARVGGIHANNTLRTEFIFDNLQIQNNVIMASLRHGVEKFIFLGSSCIYPRNAQQPMSELALLNGSLEYTNRPYAIAKIAGLELVNAIRTQHKRNFFSVMPTNLYGPGDNFHLENSHVLPALIRKVQEAHEKKVESVTIWGTGRPLREFLYVDDCADAIVHLMERIEIDSFEDSILAEGSWSHINLGSGDETSIRDLVTIIAQEVGYKGTVKFDNSRPDGTPRKLLDSSLLQSYGWKPKVGLEEGIRRTVEWYRGAPSVRGLETAANERRRAERYSLNAEI